MDIEYNDTRNHRGLHQLLAARSDLAGEGLNPPDVEDESFEEVDYSEDGSVVDDFDEEDYSDKEDENDSDEFDEEASDTKLDV